MSFMVLVSQRGVPELLTLLDVNRFESCSDDSVKITLNAPMSTEELIKIQSFDCVISPDNTTVEIQIAQIIVTAVNRQVTAVNA